MISLFDGQRYVIRLDRGERLLEQLETFCKETALHGASVSGVGGATQVELGFYNLEEREYKWQTVSKTLEITSLLGTIALDDHDQPIYHLHGTFGDEDYYVLGGHVKDLVVGGTCELIIQPINKTLHRSPDDISGLNTLNL
jgi:predicted DNA-binding protein with PD1-like motif